MIILCFASPFTLHVKAESKTTINDLIENAKKLDGKVVTIQGEAIGECMDRGEYSWVNINDGTNAIGLWLETNKAIKISRYGNYKYIGDTIKITGIFHRACTEHGGEADLHVNTLKVVNTGYLVYEKIPLLKIIGAIILVPVAFVFLVIFKKMVIKKRF